MRLIELFRKEERGTMVAGIAKACLAIGLLSVVAANFVSSQAARFDQDRLGQVAAAAAKREAIDPLVTGSISRMASQTRLDPCTATR